VTAVCHETIVPGKYHFDCLDETYDALLVANGTPLNRSLFNRLRRRAQLLVALDGGLNYFHKLGIVPDHVVGDLDSATSESLAWARNGGARVHPRPSVDEPDIAKGLKFCAKLGCRFVLLAGTAGERLDHVLANMQFASSVRGLEATIITNDVLLFPLRGRVTREFILPGNHTVSWFGLPEALGCSLAGVRWPFRNRALQVGGFHSLSNQPVDAKVVASQRKGRSVLIVSLRPEIFR
jgi:thiamine pyrophosphokinase